MVARRLRGTPFIFEVRDLWPGVPIELGLLRNTILIWVARLLEKAAYRSAAHVIALSPGMAAGVRAVNREVPITVVPNACDIERFRRTPEERVQIRRRLGFGSHERVAVYVGSFGRSYRLDFLLDIAARLPRGCRIVLVGDGASMPSLRDRARNLELKAQEILVGEKPKTEASDYVAAADVVLSSLADEPALHVNSLNKVFDGLAAGRPLVFTHDGWLATVCEETGAGLRVDKQSPDAAARQLSQLLLDDQALTEMGRAAQGLALERFDRDRLFGELIRVVSEFEPSSRPE